MAVSCWLLAIGFSILTFLYLSLFLLVARNKLVGLGNQRTLVDIQTARTFGDIGSTNNGVRDDTYRADNIVDSLSTLDGILDILQQQVGLKLDEVRLVLFDILLELLGSMLAAERVGVVAIRQQQHLHVHTLLQQHIRTTHGSMDASLVTIVEQHDIGCEAVQQAYLIVAQRRTRVGHDILQATLMHGDDVGITLHHVHAVFLDNSLLGLIDAIELAFLMIDLGVG